MKKNAKLTVGIIISLAVGYIAGGVIGIPGMDPSLLNGDISKVNKYNKAVSEDVKAFQERMENDSTFRDETLAALAIVDTRVNQFKDLTDSTAIVAKGIKDLEQSVAQIADMKEFATGAQQQADSALIVLCNMANGTKQLGADYEQLANNTFIAYSLMDKQKEAARAFVDQVDKYLYNNSKNEALLKVRDQWVAFCGDAALLNGDKAETAYWNKKAIMPNLANSQQPRQIKGIVFNRLNELGLIVVGNKAGDQLGAKAGDQLGAKAGKVDARYADQLAAKAGEQLGSNTVGGKVRHPINLNSRVKIGSRYFLASKTNEKLGAKAFLNNHTESLMLSNGVKNIKGVKICNGANNILSNALLAGKIVGGNGSSNICNSLSLSIARLANSKGGDDEAKEAAGGFDGGEDF